MGKNPINRRPVLLILANEDYRVWSHRMPVARTARDAGFDVVFATRISNHRQKIEAEGFRLVSLDWHRGTLNPIKLLASFWTMLATFRAVQPDIVHVYSLNMIITAGLAGLFAPSAHYFHSITGLGTVFIQRSWKNKLVQFVILSVLKIIGSRKNHSIIVQNSDDHALLVANRVATGDAIHIIRGSGVDTQYYLPLPEPVDGPVTLGFAARMIAEKGIKALREAHTDLVSRGLDIHLVLAGSVDPENPSSLTQAGLDKWSSQDKVVWIGEIDDVRKLWAKCHICILPSFREGLPKTLLEAAACGRALIATDVAGCREIARQDENALLVPLHDVKALAGAIKDLALDKTKRLKFSKKSRELVLSDMSARAVGNATLALYVSVSGVGGK
ncbi:MAG: glycosyltransferase family 4 protein [Cohaesibacteraceae bacterium]|nr:glycosyltransferase family 4 protein [Cohaesibacteraceae bacterium]